MACDRSQMTCDEAQTLLRRESATISKLEPLPPTTTERQACALAGVFVIPTTAHCHRRTVPATSPDTPTTVSTPPAATTTSNCRPPSTVTTSHRLVSCAPTRLVRDGGPALPADSRAATPIACLPRGRAHPRWPLRGGRCKNPGVIPSRSRS